MQWSGGKEFVEMLKKAEDQIQQAAAQAIFETAKDVRDEALEGFTTYGIRMVTGRSRAMLTAQPGPGLFKRGSQFDLEAYAGYMTWPKSDAFDDDIPFYPHFLNYGTRKMPARPYWSAAVDRVNPTIPKRMETAMTAAMAAYRSARRSAQ